MLVNYIYNENGQVEYVIIPIAAWNLVQKQIPNWVIKKDKPNPDSKFNPLKYKGLIKNLHIDIEQELKGMREEWENNF